MGGGEADPDIEHRPPSARARLLGLLAPARPAALAALLYLLAGLLWQGAARLAARGGELWAGDIELRRRLQSADAAVFLEAWLGFGFDLLSFPSAMGASGAFSFSSFVSSCASLFFSSFFRARLLWVFLGAYAAARLRLHSVLLVQHQPERAA